MKKIAKLLAYALPALVVVACTNVDDNIEPNGDSEGNGITLTLNTNTKTTLGDDGKTVTWANDDKVGLFADYVVGSEATVLGANAEYTYNNENAFTGELEYGAEVADNYNFYAYYPYAEGDVAHGAVAGTLPAAQTFDAAAESYDLSAADFMWGKAVGVAKSGNIAIEMHHTFALVQFTLTNSLAEAVSINKVTIAAEGETLAGAFTANLADGTLTFTAPAEAIDVATDLTIAAGEQGVVKFMMNAVDLSGKDVVVTIFYNGSEEYSETFEGRNFEAAGNYNKNIAIAAASVEPDPTTDWYVKTDGTGKGASWEYATTLDNALLNAPAGATIHVAAGTYVPTTEAQGAPAGDAYKTFEITKNITLKGGYPADATTGAVAAPATNATVLDGNATSCHVVLVTSSEKAVIDGFTITNGKATTGSFTSSVNGVRISNDWGAGLYVECGVAEVANCKITGNNGTAGAGFAFNNSLVDMHDCEITNNIATGNGSNLAYSDRTTPTNTVSTTIRNCVFSGNSSANAGALYVYSKNVGQTCYVANCEFSDNTSTGRGGVAYVRSAHADGVECTFVNCTFSGNSSKSLGSAIDVYGAAATPCVTNVISCTASANSAIATNANGGCFATETVGTTLNLYNTISSGNTTNGTSDANVYKKAGTINYKNVVVGDKVYGADGAVVDGKTFNASDFGTYANGVYPIANTSVAWTSGMSAADLYTTGSGINADLFTAAVMQADQKGNARTGNVMGAYVGQ